MRTSYEEVKIIGPFGIWPFPILNVIIQIIYLLGSVKTPSISSKPRIYEFVRDENGRIIQILEYEAQ